jgi:hypothetical protein
LFKDYDEIRRKEKLVQALKEKADKQEIKKKIKSVAIHKNKIMAARMETSLMNNPTMLSPFKSNIISTIGSITEEGEVGKKGGCCDKLMDCLGLRSTKPKNQPA